MDNGQGVGRGWTMVRLGDWVSKRSTTYSILYKQTNRTNLEWITTGKGRGERRRGQCRDGRQTKGDSRRYQSGLQRRGWQQWQGGGYTVRVAFVTTVMVASMKWERLNG